MVCVSHRRGMQAAFLTAVCLLLASALAPSETAPATYHDSANHFSILVPSGWKLRPLGDSVQIVRGDCYVSVLVFRHTSDTAGLLDQLAQSMGRKWKRFRSLRRGETTLAGLKAATASFSGENPQGVAALLQLTGVNSSGTAYILVTGATETDLPEAQTTLAKIEHSFSLFAAEVPAPVSPGPTLGVEVADLASDDALGFGLSNPSGALVVRIAPAGPAQQAGIRLHDLIVTAASQDIDSAAMLQQIIEAHKPGDQIALGILRPNDQGKVEHLSLSAVLTATPATP
jgi:hypothetical protein